MANKKDSEITQRTRTDVRQEADVIRGEGKAVIVPQAMSLEGAIDLLQKRIQQENQVVSFNEPIDAFPPDGAVAFHKALARIYGWVQLAPTGFWGNTPPATISVEVSPTETIKVPWGKVILPGIDGFIQTATDDSTGTLRMLLFGQCKQRHLAEIMELCDLVRDIAANESIYKGRALRLSYAKGDPMTSLRFVDLSGINPNDLVLNRDVEAQVNAFVMTPILHAEECRRAGIPAKRGVLFAGPWGTGKSMMAGICGLHCASVKRTFILLDDVTHLAQALELAKRYSPALVFAEDIDRAIGRERDEHVDAILNTIDGISAKGAEVMVVLTTNNVEEINSAMLRPGRLDAVISIAPPDAEAVTRLIRLYGRGLVIANDEELMDAGVMLAGQIPAIVREVVERAKLAAIARDPGSPLALVGQDLEVAAMTIRSQSAMIDAQGKPVERPDLERALTDVIQKATIGAAVEDLAQNEDMQEVHRRVKRIENATT